MNDSAKGFDTGLVGREKFSLRIVALLERLSAKEIFGTEEGKARFLETLSSETIAPYALAFNAVARGKNQGAFDGRYSRIAVLRSDGSSETEYLPPWHEDKQALFDTACDNARILYTEKGMYDAAAYLGAVINALHPFYDGNGRLARLLFLFLTHGYNGSAEDMRYVRELVGPSGRDMMPLDPSMLMGALEREVARLQPVSIMLDGETHTIPEFDIGISSESPQVTFEGTVGAHSKIRLAHVLGERFFVRHMLLEYLEQRSLLVEPFICRQQEPRSPHVPPYMINEQKIFERVSPDQVKLFLSIERQMKQFVVEGLFLVFAKPSSFSYGAQKTARDEFIERTKRP